MKRLLIIQLIISSLAVNAQTNDGFLHDGIDRSFIYYTPSSWTQNESLPVLFVLHGLTQDANGIMNITEFNDIAEANNFIVCYPNGINGAWNANMNITASQADDIGFIEELAAYMQNNFNTDPSKQYLSGFSNGGFMSHKIACESSQCFAAIATVSGNMSDTVDMNCNPIHPTSVLHIHGTADPVVIYSGSPTTGVSVDATIEKWQMFLACDATPITTDMPNNVLLDFSSPQRIVYQNCDASSLELIKITGGGHQWPGIVTLIGGLGNINMDFYSPQVIWDFLDGKACSETIGIPDISINETKHLIKIVDLMGRETKLKLNTPLILLYSDGTRERVMKIDE